MDVDKNYCWHSGIVTTFMMKIFIILSLALILAYAIIKREKAVVPSNTLVIALPSVQLEIDPHKMEDIQSMFLAHQLNRSLYRFRSDGQISPDLVEQADLSENRKILRLRMKVGEKFSDGTEINARHVVLSLKRPFALGASITADLSYIKGARQAIQTKKLEMLGIRQINDQEIEIEMEKPSDLLPIHLALPDLAVLKIDSVLNNKVPTVSSGSYVIIKKTPNEIHLKAWSDTKPISVKNIILRAVAPTEAFKFAIKGEVQCIEQYSLTDSEVHQLNEKGWKKSIHSLSYENFLILNPAKLSKSTRRLIKRILDNDLLANNVGLQAAYGLIPPNLPGALVERFGTDTSLTTDESEITIHYNLSNTLHQKAAGLIQNELQKYGLKIKLIGLVHNEFYKYLLSRKSQAIIAGKGIDYPDGFANLSYFRSDIRSNFLFMENGSLDSEIADLAFLSATDRIHAYPEIQKRILSQDTIVPLFFGHTSSGLWASSIKNIPPHPFGFQFLRVDEIEL